jgi:hypothetical protein
MNTSARIGQSSPTLLSLATATRFHAQRLTSWKLNIQFLAATLSAGSLFYNQILGWFLTGSALFGMATAFVIGTRARILHELSREAQRLALLEDSFGKLIEPFQTVELRRKIGTTLESEAGQTTYEQPYYTGSHSSGGARFRQNMQQSAFWSRNLLEFYYRKLRKRIVFSLVLVGLSAYGVLAAEAGSKNPVINPYLLSLGAITLISGLLGYVETAISCRSSVELLLELDKRLESLDLQSPDALLANFADYSIASVAAPPIPFVLYKKHHSYLRRLWSLRSGRETTSTRAQPPEPVTDASIECDPVILPAWLKETDFRRLIREATQQLVAVSEGRTVTQIKVHRMPGLSGVPVYDIEIYSESILWRQLVLRLHRGADEARSELAIVKKLTNESADLVAYVPVEEPFVSQGALFYYHANIQTHDQLMSLDDFVNAFFQRSGPPEEFDRYFLKMLSGLRTVARCCDDISNEYQVRSASRIADTARNELPPEFIIDLRTAAYRISENDLEILPRNRGARVTRGDTKVSPTSDVPVSVQCPVYSSHSYLGDLYEVDIGLLDSRCRLLISSLRSREWLSNLGATVTLSFIPRETVVSLKDYLGGRTGLKLDSFSPDATLRAFETKIGNVGLHLGFRHRDLHCRNCLVSLSNFKIIDVGDAAFGSLICTDLARLEISLLSRLADSMNLNGADMAEILARSDDAWSDMAMSGAASRIARVIREIRSAFVGAFIVSPTAADRALGYYIECCRQVSYSVSSPLVLQGAMISAISFWEKRMVELTT